MPPVRKIIVNGPVFSLRESLVDKSYPWTHYLLIMSHDFFVKKTPLILTSLWVSGAAYVAYISATGRKRLDDRSKLKAWAD